MREILGISKGLNKRNGIGGEGQNVPRWGGGGSETVFCGESPREVLPPGPPPAFCPPPPLAFSGKRKVEAVLFV